MSCRGKCFDLFINRQNVGFTQTELFNHIICNANEATRKTKFIMNPNLGEKMFCLIWRRKKLQLREMNNGLFNKLAIFWYAKS